MAIITYMANWATVHSEGLSKFKQGMSTIVSFTKMLNLARIYKRFEKLKQDDETGMSIIVGLTKMTNVANFANLARIHQRSGKIACR